MSGEARRAARAVSKIMRMAFFRHHHTVTDYDSAMFSYYRDHSHDTERFHRATTSILNKG